MPYHPNPLPLWPARHRRRDAGGLASVRRTVSGFPKPSAANQAAFDHAVEHVTATVRELRGSLVTNAPPRNREVEAAKKRARSATRLGPA